ncbi:Microperfuranone synthase [Paramyrothecium foliicola]|nr:Microperfuranone synthase [Paramyrothecium foliicola]
METTVAADHKISATNTLYMNGQPGPGSHFLHIPDFNRTDVDLYFISLSSNAVGFFNRSADLWYRAVTPVNVTYEDQVPLWQADELMWPMGCTSQHQVCVPSARESNHCTDLGSRYDTNLETEKLLGGDPEQIANWLMSLLGSHAIGPIVNILGSQSLTSRFGLTEHGTQVVLEPNQWQLDVQNWMSISLAALQFRLLEVASGYSPSLQKFVGGPTSPEQKRMCHNQKTPSYQLAIMVAVVAMPGLDQPHSREEPRQNLAQLLAKASTTNAKLIFYEPNEYGDLEPVSLTYSELLADAEHKSRLLHGVECVDPSSILLLHFSSQRETIQWFWAATLAGLLPAISTPLVHDATRRNKHLQHLKTLLKAPIIITTSQLMSEFDGVSDLRLFDVAYLKAKSGDFRINAEKKHKDEIAVLMLTSGSTGMAKAVAIRHGQILAAVTGKSLMHETKLGDVFLNWTSLDHVAGFIEIHLHALSLSSEQIHVPASEFLRDPLQFICLLDKHCVAYSFAPNFFLARLYDTLVMNPNFTAHLPHLTALISGGESNTVATCDLLTRELCRFGVEREKNVIRPGFGMTETCAGSIYSRNCPSYDLAEGLEFATVGSCIPGIKMRVGGFPRQDVGVRHEETTSPRESGELQVTGTIVFSEYFNDLEATAEAFTHDGWFRTGDLARIDPSGNLVLLGRIKDTIIINGISWSSTEIERAIEEEIMAGLTPSYTVAISHRPSGSPTEEVAIVYSPDHDMDDDGKCFDIARAITGIVSRVTGRNPVRVIPLPQTMLEKSSLGKISRARVRTAFENGEYAAIEQKHNARLTRHQEMNFRQAQTNTEKIIQNVLGEVLGIDSFSLVALKSKLQVAMDINDIPISTFLVNPTVGDIASSISEFLAQPPVYSPIVPLQLHGNKTPLFCLHPGCGEILVYIALATYFPTRPIYAVRARGYNPGESPFNSIAQAADTYTRHIRKTQPTGPYALAGYSLGSTIAYEVCKRLEAEGQEVRFLASIDYPPHIAQYVRPLKWIDVLMHTACFLELIDEVTMARITPHMHTLQRDAALGYILTLADQERAKALAIDKNRVALISDVADNFRINAERYEPVGKVMRVDVFVASDPPHYTTRDREDWRDNKLGRWADFSRESVEFHDCPGVHATMLNRENVAAFARILKSVMKSRGV